MNLHFLLSFVIHSELLTSINGKQGIFIRVRLNLMSKMVTVNYNSVVEV